MSWDFFTFKVRGFNIVCHQTEVVPVKQGFEQLYKEDFSSEVSVQIMELLISLSPSITNILFGN
jgi:hypothetical protein